MEVPAPADGSTSNVDLGSKDDRFYYHFDRFSAKPKFPIPMIPSLDADVEGVPSHHNETNKEGIVSSQKASTSYEEARDACKGKVQAIANECKRLNIKYYDRSFDLPSVDTLQSLEATEVPSSLQGLVGVRSVKRVEDIFDNPVFFEDGATADDIRQGSVGDCWFLAAVTALSGKPELLERICVARDEKVGVYGFVFYRDGEWISEVVDDRLCLRQGDDKWSYPTEYMVNLDGSKPLRSVFPLVQGEYYLSKLPKSFREDLRKGSNSLYFSSCRSKNETWLPLLEKAYSKAHGDYQAISGGFAGEGIEDLTGGVASYLYSENVLDKDKLWTELLQVNQNFLFGAGSRYGQDSDPQDDEGFVRGHAYTVLEAREVNDMRLLKIRNPWGTTEWNGAWSDGSKEWTAEMMKELDHTFGDDGIFWISYGDFLKYYPEIDRTRLFTDEWTVTQQWTSVDVPWTNDYLSTRLTFSLSKRSPVVLVLSQPDNRYFQGLTGRYWYDLHFRLYKNGEKTYLARSMQDSGSGRSCSAELDLEAGEYTVYVKVNAGRTDTDLTYDEVIKRNREARRNKLQDVCKSFDLVHSKGRLRQTEKARDKRLKADSKSKTKAANVAERASGKKGRERARRRQERLDKEKERKLEAKKLEKKLLKTKEKRDMLKKKAMERSKETIDQSSSTENAEQTKDADKETNNTVDPVRPSQQNDAKAEGSSVDLTQSDKNEGWIRLNRPRPTSSSGPSANAPEKEETPNKKDALDVQVPTVTESAAAATTKDTISAEQSSDTDPAQRHDSSHVESSKTRITITVDAEPSESEEEASDTDVSSVCDEDFDWDSEIDGSGPSDSEEGEPEVDDLYKDKPWYAICVIGLKVCHIGAGAEIQVLH